MAGRRGAGSGPLMQIAEAEICASTFPQGGQERLLWRAALSIFACVNAAATGVFFTVFAGLVYSPPSPRNALHSLLIGVLAFAVLILGQFIHWSRLALFAIKERGS